MQRFQDFTIKEFNKRLKHMLLSAEIGQDFTIKDFCTYLF